MPKRPLKLTIRIPPYHEPRNAWRRQLHKAITAVQRKSPVAYQPSDKLEVEVRLYMSRSALGLQDVDNRVKDILDALQGRAGGPKNERRLRPIIPNDSQVYRVIVEKALPPGQSHGLGHLIVRRLGTWRLVRKRRSG